MPCQSGRNLAGAVLALASAAIPALCGAQAVSWAHQNGSLQSNGAITIKSQSGGSYAGQVNPAGAVAKANQSAVTQPPTVIIQATSTGNPEMIPIVVSGTTTIPTCPVGYTSVFARSGTGYSLQNLVFNVAGSKFTFGTFLSGSSYTVGFGVDAIPAARAGGSAYSLASDTGQPITGGQQWAATLCSK